jgi:hypothetical protein
MSCECPEVHINREWQSFCERQPPMDAAGPDPSPTMWRCPHCRGSIVRTFHEVTREGEPSHHVDDLDNEREVERAGFRCRSASCGWASWIARIR